jgi:beta-glucanase (GH16 family)
MPTGSACFARSTASRSKFHVVLVRIAVALVSSTIAFSAFGASLISMQVDWPTWQGQASGITYNAQSNALTIPAPSGGASQVSGYHWYDQALSAGVQYTFSVSATDSAAAAVIVLSSGTGDLQITNADTGVSGFSAMASPGHPLRFVAPANVSGFLVKVQSAWLASAATSLAVDLSGAGTGNPPPANDDFRPAGYQSLLFSDEFDGNALDRSKWCTRLAHGGGPFLQVPDAECTKFSGNGTGDFANESENQRFRDFNRNNQPLHVVSNGTIKLVATLTGVDFARRFESAALRSKRTFAPTATTSYYVTARVKLPSVLGVWPAFWLNPSFEPNGFPQWPPEIDILEAPVNGGPAENTTTLSQHAQVQGAQTNSRATEFTFSAPGYNTTWGYWSSGRNLRDIWIEVGVEWTNTGLCYFVDGFKTACENYRWVGNNGAAGQPATLIMMFAIGGPWAGRNGVNDAAFPTQLEVDHIRVYQK